MYVGNIKNIKMNKEKVIGYTTGVFDLFHIGHLNVIKRAKEQCDYLIVGVSTDSLVESYKNHRPVIPYEERAAIVEALKYVDEVVPQESMDKYAAWEKYHFNKIFHGDDWKNTDLYKAMKEKLESVGVESVYFPYTKNTSSTLISSVLKKINEE